MQLSEITNAKIVVHCNTKEKSDEFMQLCDKAKIKWRHGDKASQYDAWSKIYRKDTCYGISEKNIFCGSVTYFTEQEFLIVDFDDVFKGKNTTEIIINTIITTIHNYNCENEILEYLQKWNEEKQN